MKTLREQGITPVGSEGQSGEADEQGKEKEKEKEKGAGAKAPRVGK